MKIHTKYTCDICQKTFKYEDAKSKHNKIVHENVKLYCHYFNNQKDCPFKEECVFIHEVSTECKYGDICEREFCMFRHGINNNEAILEDIEEEEEIHNANKTFENPANFNIETVEMRVNVPCRDTFLQNDQTFYWNELEKFSEIEKIEHLYVHAQSGYTVGTYLDTYIKFKTKYAQDFKNNKDFRKTVWDRLNIRDKH